MNIFPSKDDVREIEIAAASKLKSLFKVETDLEKITRIVTKQEKADEEEDQNMEEEDQGFLEGYGGPKDEEPEPV